MCTVATYKTKDFYFGRTLDYDFSYDNAITVTPRNFPFAFRHMETLKRHYALIGMAYTAQGYPLYYDAVNRKAWVLRGLILWGTRTIISAKKARTTLHSLNLSHGFLGSAPACGRHERSWPV